MKEFRPVAECPRKPLSDLVVMIRSHIYGDRGSVSDPECILKVKVDLWVTVGEWKGGSFSKPKMKYFARATVDTERKKFFIKDGSEITVANPDQAIQMILKSIREAKEAADE